MNHLPRGFSIKADSVGVAPHLTEAHHLTSTSLLSLSANQMRCASRGRATVFHAIWLEPPNNLATGARRIAVSLTLCKHFMSVILILGVFMAELMYGGTAVSKPGVRLPWNKTAR